MEDAVAQLEHRTAACSHTAKASQRLQGLSALLVKLTAADESCSIMLGTFLEARGHVFGRSQIPVLLLANALGLRAAFAALK